MAAGLGSVVVSGVDDGTVAVGDVVGTVVGAALVGAEVDVSRLGDELVELVLEVVLRTGGLDAGAPQLVGDEAEHQQAQGDQDLRQSAHVEAPSCGSGGRSHLLTSSGGPPSPRVR